MADCGAKGPGPSYALKTLTGYEDHDFSKNRAPAYSLGLKVNQGKGGITPGPYNVNGVDRHGKYPNLGWTMESRAGLSAKPFGPSPLSYSPEKMKHYTPAALTDINQNLAPSELKKIRNKLRKQRAKEDLERKQAQEKQEKRELHNKSRQQVAGDAEPDAPKQDELIPEKLARVEDPLEQAIKFLQPLQNLASDRIQTHLMAFEIYYRKGKPLLMLQSIRRAHKVEPNNPELHTCLVRYKLYLDGHRSDLEQPVITVIDETMKPIWGEKDAKTLNAEYLSAHKHNIRYVLQGARMLYFLEPQQQELAVSLATCLKDHVQEVTIENCTAVLEALKDGDFGNCPNEIESFRALCQAMYPHAVAFKERTPMTDADESNIGMTVTSISAAEAGPNLDCNHVTSSSQEN